MNPHEHLARSAKVLRLTAAIKDAVRTGGIPAERVGPEKPPSPTTIRAVLAQYGEGR